MKGKIFLSYRRDGGFEMARLIRERLQARGYKVFLDVEELRSGPFNTALFAEIESSTDVVVILSPNSLDRCLDESDWLRLEVAHAIRKKKNIVPVMTRGFKWPPQPLPDDIVDLPSHNGIEPSHEYFDASMDKLCKLLIGQTGKHTFKQWKGPYKAIVPLLLIIGLVMGGYYYSGWRFLLKEMNPILSKKPSSNLDLMELRTLVEAYSNDVRESPFSLLKHTDSLKVLVDKAEKDGDIQKKAPQEVANLYRLYAASVLMAHSKIDNFSLKEGIVWLERAIKLSLKYEDIQELKEALVFFKEMVNGRNDVDVKTLLKHYIRTAMINANSEEINMATDKTFADLSEAYKQMTK